VAVLAVILGGGRREPSLALVFPGGELDELPPKLVVVVEKDGDNYRLVPREEHRAHIPSGDYTARIEGAAGRYRIQPTRIRVRRHRAVRLTIVSAPPPPPMWVDVFDGQSMEGWQAHGSGNWSVEDGILVGRGGRYPGGWLSFTRAEFSDVEVRVECKIGADGNSGLLVRR
jgi:hypothetical protein